MDSDHDYRLKGKDGWTKNEFQKIFPYSTLIWPLSEFSGKGAPTDLSAVHVVVRSPFDGLILEGIINKLARKNLAQYYEELEVHPYDSKYDSSLVEGLKGSLGLVGIGLHHYEQTIPDRVVLDLNTTKMSELKNILSDLQNAKNMIQDLTGTLGIATAGKDHNNKKIIQKTSWGKGWYDFIKSDRRHPRNVMSTIDKEIVSRLVEKYLEFIDPEFLAKDIDKVEFIFVSKLGGNTGDKILKKINQYKQKQTPISFSFGESEDLIRYNPKSYENDTFK